VGEQIYRSASNPIIAALISTIEFFSPTTC
jgi:hypothetical protein